MSNHISKYSNGIDVFGWFKPVHIDSFQFPKWKEFIDNNVIDEDLDTLYQIFLIKQKKQLIIDKKLNKTSNFVNICIQDFQRRLSDLDKLNTFISNIKYLYSEGYYCIESGKANPPNLHIHLLVKIINPKHHKEKLNREWIKLFNTSLYDKDYYLLKQWRESHLMPPYNQWVNEKLDYFDNEKKGNHANSIELNSRGSWGVD